MTGLGTMATPEGDRIDFGRLRDDRRRRLLDAMAAHRLDALVLGRPANVLYASGARQLWTSGARPFGPACVVVAATSRVHLLSTWDEGVPADIDHEDLYGLSWNPANLARSLGAIPGLAAARRLGTDSTSPLATGLLTGAAPDAAIVDGRAAITAARATKTADELACLATATAMAEAGLAAMVAALAPGVTERQLLGTHLEHIAALGSPTPPTEGVVCITPRHEPVALRRIATDRALAPGELVVLDPGALFAGYEGGVGRTWPLGPPTADQRELAARCRAGLDAVVAACRSGATGAELRTAWLATGEPLPAAPVIHGVGLGMEQPVVGNGIGGSEVLAAGTVLAVTSWVAREGVGGFLERDLVVVGDAGPEVLSRYGHGPAGAA
ncbi:MAG: Xaa-Pro aminopeptidase [Actinomycetia bacterium]|nr:Xaa-Pro aminopeptidase [Actinomycetes bacterium]